MKCLVVESSVHRSPIGLTTEDRQSQDCASHRLTSGRGQLAKTPVQRSSGEDSTLPVPPNAAQSTSGPAPKLHTLAPEYRPAQHGVYVEILKRAIEKQPEVRNIALAGTYGTGKSSILREVSNQFPGRVIELSLLTLGAEPEPSAAGADSNPAAATTTNRIQKEIVKQLLYQQRPSSAPESRFRRIARFGWLRELLIALAVGLGSLVFLLALGIDVSVLPNLGLALAPIPIWLRTVSVYMAVPIAVGLGVLIVRLLVLGRFGLEKINAGPATITLPPRSSSYFDEYLDEIIYFFETNRTRDIVIIEDLDRFNDPRIFEALRSLNSLLNAASQLNARNIRFIYAVRDSVFERLGRDDAGEKTDEARAELVRANRTKFFELVVPVVPFITHKNARDLMHELLADRGHEISRDLIDLAARHVADMRLIHNIVNEYEVFKHRLISVENPVPELDPERLFAMILFKNAHMADFEAIRQGTSSIDALYETWRALVAANLRANRLQNAKLKTRIAVRQRADERASVLAVRLRSTVTALTSARGNTFADKRLYLDGAPVDDARLETPAFWNGVVGAEFKLSLLMYTNYATSAMELSRDAIQTLMGEAIDVDEYADSSAAADQETVTRNQANSAFLRRHTWKQLFERPEFHYAASNDSEARSFSKWAEHLLPSRLALDLVLSGFITPYFNLHVSSFYGQLIRPDAMTYVMRCIDRGVADPEYSLDGADVEAIIRDQGASVLNERSMFNISILDYLLVARPKDALVVSRNLAGRGEEGLTFIDQYLSSGAEKSEMVAQLSPYMPSIFTFLASSTSLEYYERVTALDAAIGARSADVPYDDSDELRAFVESAYKDFPSLNEVGGTTSPGEAVRFVASIRSRLPSVAGLSEASREELLKTRAYALTWENLELLAKTKSVSLDALQSAGREIFAYAIDQVDRYLQARDESPTIFHTVENPDVFVEILNASDRLRAADYAAIVSGAHPDCAVDDVTDVPHPAWPPLAASLRIPMTYPNVSAYVDWMGEVDGELALSLQAAGQIVGIDVATIEQRVELALTIVNASGALPDPGLRVALTQSLNPGQLPTASIDPSPGELVGRLVQAKLLTDNEEAFLPRLMVDWPTLEFTILNSSRFLSMLTPETLPAEYIAPLMRSPKIENDLRGHVAAELATFTNVPKDAYQATAEAAVQDKFFLGALGIETVLIGGASHQVVVELLAKAGDQITDDELRRILRRLGEPYSLIADKGRQRPKLADSVQHRLILDRLQRADVVSGYTLGLFSTLKVNLRYA